MPVSCCLTPEHRRCSRLLLADILAKHLNDDSRWVRISAFQILGPFISTFNKQFSEVTYNKNGELVYTSKQDNRRRYIKVLSYCPYNLSLYRSNLNACFCSIRYSYEGIFLTKGVNKSQISDMDDNTKSSFYVPVMNVRMCDDVKKTDSSRTEGDDDQMPESVIQLYKVC